MNGLKVQIGIGPSVYIVQISVLPCISLGLALISPPLWQVLRNPLPRWWLTDLLLHLLLRGICKSYPTLDLHYLKTKKNETIKSGISFWQPVGSRLFNRSSALTMFRGQNFEGQRSYRYRLKGILTERDYRIAQYSEKCPISLRDSVLLRRRLSAYHETGICACPRTRKSEHEQTVCCKLSYLPGRPFPLLQFDKAWLLVP